MLVIAAISCVRAFAEPWPGGRSRNAASKATLGSRQGPGQISGAEERLTLRIYNYAPVDPVILQRAEGITAAIFEDSGIGISWMECTPLQGQPLPYAVCPSDMGASDLVLRFLPRRMAMKLAAPHEPLGYAQQCPETEPACEVTVFYFRVDELASEGYRAENILGHVIAHEVAHVLIGPGHSDDGIMRREWSREELRWMSLGLRLGFSNEQSRRLQNAGLGRMKVTLAEKEAS